MKTIALVLIAFMLWTATAIAGNVGFQRTTVSDSNGRPREAGIWYASGAPASVQPLGPSGRPSRSTVRFPGGSSR